MSSPLESAGQLRQGRNGKPPQSFTHSLRCSRSLLFCRMNLGGVARIRQAPHGPDHLLQLRSDRQAQELAASDQRYLVSRNNSGANGRQRSQ